MIFFFLHASNLIPEPLFYTAYTSQARKDEPHKEWHSQSFPRLQELNSEKKDE